MKLSDINDQISIELVRIGCASISASNARLTVNLKNSLVLHRAYSPKLVLRALQLVPAGASAQTASKIIGAFENGVQEGINLALDEAHEAEQDAREASQLS